MKKIDLFYYTRDYIFCNRKQIAHTYDILIETKDTVNCTKQIDSYKEYAVASVEYEKCVNIKN